jgi:hypothetical protein
MMSGLHVFADVDISHSIFQACWTLELEYTWKICLNRLLTPQICPDPHFGSAISNEILKKGLSNLLK